jgi:hypothetical protein
LSGERKTYTWDDHLFWRQQMEERAKMVFDAIPDASRRQRPRDPEKAALLHRLGCPDRLIGPVDRDG